MKKAKTRAQLYDQMRRGLLMFLAGVFELVTNEKPPNKPEAEAKPESKRKAADGEGTSLGG